MILHDCSILFFIISASPKGEAFLLSNDHQDNQLLMIPRTIIKWYHEANRV